MPIHRNRGKGHGNTADIIVGHRGQLYSLTPLHLRFLKLLAEFPIQIKEAAYIIRPELTRHERPYNRGRVGQITGHTLRRNLGLGVHILFTGPVKLFARRNLITCSAYRNGKWDRSTRDAGGLWVQITELGREILALVE